MSWLVGHQLKGHGGWVLGGMGTWRRGVVGSWSQSSGWTSRPRALAPGPQPHPHLETKIRAFTINPPFEQLQSYNKDIRDKKPQLLPNTPLHTPPGAQGGLEIGWETKSCCFPLQTAPSICSQAAPSELRASKEGVKEESTDATSISGPKLAAITP